MGNETSGNWWQDINPDLSSLHPDGLVLGGLSELNQPANDPPAVLNRQPANGGAVPWTVADGGKTPAILPNFRQAPTRREINDPNAVPPSDAELGFDLNGPGHWGAFFRHPLDAFSASNLAGKAKDTTLKQFPQDTDPHNDDADAFRHAYWNYTMTKAFGADEARLFGNAHEISAPNPMGERYMDLYNNQIGRDLASSEQGDPVALIKNAVGKGLTRNSPFNRR